MEITHISYGFGFGIGYHNGDRTNYGDGWPDGYGDGHGDGSGTGWASTGGNYIHLFITNRSFDGHLINLFFAGVL